MRTIKLRTIPIVSVRLVDTVHQYYLAVSEISDYSISNYKIYNS